MALGPYLLLATLEGLVTAAVLALMALGLSLVFGVMRIVNVAHGEFFMLGAVLAWAFSTAVSGHPAIGFVVALVLSPLVVGAIAFASERIVLQRLGYNPEGTIVAIADKVRQSPELSAGLSVRATEEACAYLEHPLMESAQRAMLADVLQSSFCGRFSGRWNDPTSDAGLVWAMVSETTGER